MRKQMIQQSAHEVATQVRAVEDSIEAALIELAELQGRMIRARAVAGIGIGTGRHLSRWRQRSRGWSRRAVAWQALMLRSARPKIRFPDFAPSALATAANARRHRVTSGPSANHLGAGFQGKPAPPSHTKRGR
jgi:hypothetical protein